MRGRIRILNVANRQLPDNDYRMGYQRYSAVAEVVYGLPGRPASLLPEQFIQFDFGEGLGCRDLRIFHALFRHLRRHRNEYDFVHFFSTKLQLFGPLWATLAGVPCLTTMTGFGRTFNRGGLRYRLLRSPYLALAELSIRLSRATFFQNHGDLHWLAGRLPGLTDKMFWIGSGVDAEPVPEKDFSSRPLKVLMAARLMPDKGIPIFLKVAERLQGHFRFLLAGPASAGQHRLHDQVQHAHRIGSIEYLGELTSEELATRYGDCHVLAFPSRGEGMPRVMLEAGHHLMCPVASDIPAHRDLVAPGRGFLLTPDQEVECMISHLRRLDDDRTELEQNAHAYQQHILNHFTLKAYAQRMDDFLLRLPHRGARRLATDVLS